MISEGKSVTTAATTTNGKNDGEAKTTPGYLRGDLFIKDDYAEIFEAKNLEKDNENCLRFYKAGPNYWTLQIRTFKPITSKYGRNKGKARNMVASISLDVDELKQILAHMEATK